MKIIKIKYDNSYMRGCETCDYGSQYIFNIMIETEDKIITIKSNCQYAYLFTEEDIMVILGNAQCEQDIVDNLRDIAVARDESESITIEVKSKITQ